jgi:hypothetical protein
LIEIGAQEDAAEFAGAKHGEFLAGKFAGHDANIVTDAGRWVNKRLRDASGRMRAR